MVHSLSATELQNLPAAVDLVTAGRAVGIGRTKAYELARAGEFPVPVLRLGNSYRVSRTDLLRLLGESCGLATATASAERTCCDSSVRAAATSPAGHDKAERQRQTNTARSCVNAAPRPGAARHGTMTAAPPLPEVVSMSGHDRTLGEVDGRGALFVLPVVSDAARRHAHEIAEAVLPLTEQQREVIRRCLAPPVRSEPARRKAPIQRLALRSVQARSAAGRVAAG